MKITTAALVAACLGSGLYGCGSADRDDGVFPVSGTLSGLVGDRVVLALEGQELTLHQDGTFEFADGLADGASYDVRVAANPTSPRQTCLVERGTGTIARAAVSDVRVVCTADLGAVAPLYADGAWGSYVENDGPSPLAATGAACKNSGDRLDRCLHAGEMRTLSVRGVTSCEGVTAADTLGAFRWVCEPAGGAIRIVSPGLAPGARLSQLLDFDAVTWRDNVVVVHKDGAVFAATTPGRWWSNPVATADDPGETRKDLGAAGTVYLITRPATGSYAVTADSVSLVVRPGVNVEGKGGSATVLAEGRRHLWVEGRFARSEWNVAIQWKQVTDSVIHGLDGLGTGRIGHVDLIASMANRVDDVLATVKLTESHYNRFHELRSERGDTGVDLDGANHNRFDDVEVRDPDGISTTGVHLDQSSDNVFTRVSVENADYGIDVDSFAVGYSSDNRFHDIDVANARYGAIIAGPGNVISQLRVFNSREIGLLLASIGGGTTIVAQATIVNSARDGVYVDGTADTLISITSINNGGAAVHARRPSIRLHGIAAGNSQLGLWLENNVVSVRVRDVAAAHHTEHGIRLDQVRDGQFDGILAAGNNAAGDCLTSGTSPGLTPACEPAARSTSTYRPGLSLSSAFVGKIASDPVHTGPSEPRTSKEVGNWLGFANPFRGWGLDGGAFPGADHRGVCTDDIVCRVWDVSLSMDPNLRNVLSLPTGDDTFVVGLGEAFVTILAHAIEVIGDHIGNDNAVCESNETCLFTPNIGSYQGHGALVSAGPFVNGKITGVTLLRHAENGY